MKHMRSPMMREKRTGLLDFGRRIQGKHRESRSFYARSLLLLIATAVAALLQALPPAQPAVAHPGLVRGVALSGISRWTMDLARRAGFTHLRATITWRALQSSPRRFEFNKKSEQDDLDNI